jgi:hypothetical protein
VLTKIARDGHVYAVTLNWSDLTRANGRLSPALVGLNRASTFTGFCSIHDSKGFAPVENQRFEPTPEQLGLLAYRALCRELYAKRAQLRAIDTLRQGDRGVPIQQQVAFQRLISSYAQGVQIGLGTLEHYKNRFDVMLGSATWGGLRAYVVDLESAPDVLLSGFIYPEADFSGNWVQQLGRAEHADGLAVSSIATDIRGGYRVHLVG